LPVDWEARLRATLLSFPRAGVGEIGLDTRLTPLPLPVQLEVFRTQLRVAREMNRPCTVHLIGARAEALTSIRSEKPPRVLLHSFGGSAAEVSDWRTLPLWFSFGGGLLCDSVSDKRIAALRSVPADRLLLETDAPYQHPLGREHRMEPARLLTVAEAVAAFRGQRVEDLLQQVETNARNFINPGENS
jgi:TatD DNase family protein